MKGKEKTKEPLQNELVKLRQQITELQKLEIKYQQVEKTLGENEEKYRILVEMAADGIVIETVEGRILECNTAGAKIYGYTKEEMVGLTLADLVPEEFGEKLPRVITDKETTHGIFLPRISKKKNGTIFPTEIASKIINIAGKPRLIAYIRDITKRKKAEKKLKKARKMFASLFNSSPEATLYHDKEGRIININPRFTELFGYTPKEIIGRKIDKGMIYPAGKIEEGNILTQKAFNGFSDYETIRKKKDGTLISVIISAAPVIIDQKVQGTIALYKDITESKKAEEALRESQQEFATLFEGSPQAAIYHDEKGVILNINSRFTELFGYTLKEVKGKSIGQGMIFPQDKTREESERLTKIALEGKIVEHETIGKKKDGTLVPVIITTSSVLIKEKSRGIIAFYKDITKQKSILEKLKESEEKYRNLFEDMQDVYYRADEEGNILMINPAGIKLFGYHSKEEIIGKNMAYDFYLHPEERKKNIKKTEKGKGSVKGMEITLKKKDGTPIIVTTTSHFIYDKKGNVGGIEGLLVDVTERKKAEEALKKSQQEFASIFKNIPQAVVYLDENSNIKNISPRFTELFGYSLEEIKGRNINDGMIHPLNKREEGKNMDNTALSEGYFNHESIRMKKDGTCFPVSISASNIVIGGQVKGIIGTYFDITERKKMEGELEKLAHFDALTSCYSRGYGLSLLEQQIKTAKRKKTTVLLIYLDIDDFKHINDTFGHKEGDEVLKEAAKLFQSTLRKMDIICRIGGDEFLLIFLEDSLNDAPFIRGRLNKSLKKLNQKLAKPYEIDFSIGLSVYEPSNPLSIEELIRIADENMYEEKKKKKDGK